MNQCYDSFRLKILATLVLMCLFLAGCAAPTQGGQAVLDSPCDAPCWQNITPGETQSEPLVELLEAVPDMEKSQIVRLPKWNRYDEIVHFNFEDQKVEGEI
ncbi:MAG: hypothetical protein HGA23_11090, partial [Bacteroidales bacterium]|nr:hypothetical protein [Bacteroidales bacterium]